MRSITYVKFHEPVFYPGVGDLGNSIPSPKKALPDLKMEEYNGGILIRVKGAEIFVPGPNIVFAVLGTEVK